MIDLHSREVLQEIRDLIIEFFEGNENYDDPTDRYTAAEDLLQDVQDRIEPLIESDL